MSYILEALKKSEYARQHGRVTDGAALPPLATFGYPPRSAYRLPIVVGGSLLLVVAVTGWWRPWQEATSPAAGPDETTVAPLSVRPVPTIGAAALPPVTAEPVDLPSAPATTVIRLPPPRPATLAAAQPATPPPAALAPQPVPPKRVLSYFELPATVRERLPGLTVAGFSYAEQPELRLAVINDKVLQQGEDAAPGIVLERITSDGVVLNFAGYRFRPQR